MQFLLPQHVSGTNMPIIRSPGALAHFGGPLGLFVVQGLKIKFYSGGIFPFGESPKLKFYCGVLAHFGGPLGPFGAQGLKIKFYFGAFTHR
jgi:hypothetical protein